MRSDAHRIMPDSRASRRRADAGEQVPLTVRLLVEDVHAFVHTYFPDVLQGGMFIRTETPDSLVLGTRVQLRFMGSSGSCLFAGRGVVAWVQRGSQERGLGVQFLSLEVESHQAYREMLRLKRDLEQRQRQVEEEINDPQAVAEWSNAPTRQLSARDNPGVTPRPQRKTPHSAKTSPSSAAPRSPTLPQAGRSPSSVLPSLPSSSRTPSSVVPAVGRPQRRPGRVGPPPPPPPRVQRPTPKTFGRESSDYSEKIILPMDE